MSADKFHFVVIDDSKLDCFIAEKVIQNTGRCESVKSFMMAADALEHLGKRPYDASYIIMLLVDIQMPIMNGFEFIEAFEAMISETERKQYIINLLSSSINESDMIRAKAYQCVKTFLNKPLTKASLEDFLTTV